MPKRLLLPSAKSGVLLGDSPRPLSPWWRRVALVLGCIAVVVGALDVLNRVEDRLPANGDTLFTAFAPAALLFEPEVRQELQATTTAPFAPTRVLVPTIGVDTKVEQVGQIIEGSMATPKVITNVAWYKLGAKPGEAGSAVFAGHVNNALGLPGVFKKLNQVKKGDMVEVLGGGGEKLVYKVESVITYKESEAPLEEIFTKTGPSRVILITCEGDWDEVSRTFNKRLVVVAYLQ